MLDKIKRKLFQIFLRPSIEKKINKTSFYSKNGVHLIIPSGVFHPKYFFSTQLLLEYVLHLDIQMKTLLELGAGNGLISISAAKKGAITTSSDISKKAILSLHENAKNNNVAIQIIESDLFDTFSAQKFDFIAINPPYYSKEPRNDFEKAWYCGEHFEYFEKLFSQISNFIKHDTIIMMVLSEDCNLNMLKKIAEKNNFIFVEKLRKKKYWEWDYIFELKKL